jgi:putative ABC transport system permease protein
MDPNPGSFGQPRRPEASAARRIIGLVSTLVPELDRDDWRREWDAEILHDLARRLALGENRAAAHRALWRRALASLPDALWLRRRRAPQETPTMRQDIRFAFRAAVRRPGASLVLILTLALGIGATTSIFSVVDAVMLRPAPFPDAGRLAELLTHFRTVGFVSQSLDPEVARFWGQQEQLFDRVEPYTFETVHLTGTVVPRRVLSGLVSPGLLSLLGAKPLQGRLFTDDDVRDGAEVALIGEDLWRSALGGSPDVVGTGVRLDDRLVTVVGVLPRTFRFPAGTELLQPLRPDDVADGSYSAVVHLASTVAPSLAQSEVDAIAERMNGEQPRDEPGWNVKLRLLGSGNAPGNAKSGVWTLAGAVLCVLLIACANAANLLMVQATGRRREMAIKAALGARRSRLIRQLLTESLVLTGIAGTLGVLLAWWSLQGIVGLMPREMTLVTYTSIALDGRVLLFALLLTGLTGLTFSIGPAIRYSRQGTRLAGPEGGTMAPRARRDARNVLVVVEFALSTMLLVGAGLLINSFARLARVDVGVEVDRLLSVHPLLPPQRYPDAARARAVNEQFLERLRALPGVEAVTYSHGPPPHPSIVFGTVLEAEGQPPLPPGRVVIPVMSADTNYFSTLGIPIRLGRGFATTDVGAESNPVVIDPDLAERLWGSANPVGQRFRLDPESEWRTVIGVADDVKLIGPDDRSMNLGYYVPGSLDSRGAPTFILRAKGDPASLLAPVRQVARELDPDIPLENLSTWKAMFAETTLRPRFVLTLMSVLAGVALLLAAVGIYGVMAYVVSMRTQEIGVRMALGARVGEIRWGVLRDAFVLVGLGAAIGLMASVALGGWLRSQLFGVMPGDPLTLAAVTASLAVVAGIAAYIPARRASRVSPMRALRYE